LQQRFAIAPLQLPQTSFFNEPQRHRGHREREIAPLNLPNSDRIPPTPQIAIALPPLPQTVIAPPQIPKQQSHPLNFPNSDRIPSNFPNSDRTPSTPQKRSHPLNFQTSFFNKPRRREEHEGRREERAIANVTKSLLSILRNQVNFML
jgi:hypothetical protein